MSRKTIRSSFDLSDKCMPDYSPYNWFSYKDRRPRCWTPTVATQMGNVPMGVFPGRLQSRMLDVTVRAADANRGRVSPSEVSFKIDNEFNKKLRFVDTSTNHGRHTAELFRKETRRPQRQTVRPSSFSNDVNRFAHDLPELNNREARQYAQMLERKLLQRN